MRIAALLVLLAVAVSADTRAGERIVGGSVTTINAYPFAASILHGPSLLSYYQYCGGAILNNRSILSAAHCFVDRAINQFRVRVGSTWANSGGTVHNTAQIIININYNRWTLDSDIAILRTATNIAFIANTVQAGYIAGSNYNLLDNQIVYGIGWGRIAYNGAQSEQLRQVQVWSVNQATCRLRFLEVGWNVTDNMLCAGWLDVGGRAQCVYDEGSPLLHNNTIVGVYSFGYQCGLARYPQVNTRVSRFTSWIQTNA